VDRILEIKNLQTFFYTEDGVAKAVNGIDFEIDKGETLGIVGESGCGKSVTSMSILRLVSPPGKIVGGEILFNGQNLQENTESQMRLIRGNEISMIFQEPMTSLNPVFTVGDQIAEILRVHRGMTKKEAKQKTIEMLELVGIPSPKERRLNYPHQMSGGMKQRVMIAMALACEPKLLIADEPTTALDVTIQAQILELMKNLKKRLNTAIMLITHDLGVVSEMADKVYVMYAGKGMEYAPAERLFNHPLHPYTLGLLNSMPDLESDSETMNSISGTVPSMFDMPKGCSFQPRCDKALDICSECEPDMYRYGDNHFVRCHLYGDEK
jgi:oligopeptide/dipeptide ABC transporter ATP-binding protein